MNNNSTSKTLIVAVLLSIVCSVFVSTAAIELKSLQVENKRIDVQKNLLLAAGLLDNPKADKKEVTEAFKVVETKLIDLSTGEEVDGVNPETYDAVKASKDPKRNYNIPSNLDLAGIKKRSAYQKVYLVKDGQEVNSIIFLIHGKGLWSTMYGCIALSPDFKTVKGIGFYQHGETPGLGGEIENPKWQASWVGKQVLDENLKPILDVVKGQVDPNNPNSNSQIDGLSGATITSVGVEGTILYWLGENGYGPFMQQFLSNQNISQEGEV